MPLRLRNDLGAAVPLALLLEADHVSIYASCLSFDNEEHASSCGRMVPLADGESIPHLADEFPVGVLNDDGAFWMDDSRACTCGGDDRAPLVYRGSHIVPGIDGDQRGGEFDLGTIPPHISRNGIEHDEEEETRHDWLRVGMSAAEQTYGGGGSAIILIDRAQVTELRDWLTSWLDRGVAW